jgi:hypothetical protein
MFVSVGDIAIGKESRLNKVLLSEEDVEPISSSIGRSLTFTSILIAIDPIDVIAVCVDKEL